MEQANKIDDLYKIIERYSSNKDIFFRGQSANYPSITCSIARDKGHLENEYAIYAESIEMKQHEFASLSKPIQRVAKMQHYGIPTRLIDITSGPLIALFFAVQNSDNTDDGYVYLYSQQQHDLDSRNVRLLSLLVTLENYEIENIQQNYENEFGETISKEEILALAQETSFVQQEEGFRELNPRLFNQEGTFAICGNEVVDGKIQRQLKTLDSVEPLIIVKIPYEYKASIKRELDEKHAINEAFIYPELPSVASYLKDKYKYKQISNDKVYDLMEETEISTGTARRISLVILLSKRSNIEEIKNSAMNLIEEYKTRYDVIWIYVAKDRNDYIMRNWILTGQWINNELPQSSQPVRIDKVVDSQGYSWKQGDSYSVLSDFYEENIFVDDKELYVKYQTSYQDLRVMFDQLQNSFLAQNFDLFKKESNQYAQLVSQYFIAQSDFGKSRNKQLDDFFHNYHKFTSLFDNIFEWLKRDDLNDRTWKYFISNCFKEANQAVNVIDSSNEIWKKKLNVTKEDIENYSYVIGENVYNNE
ncbi:FRG domain-containing protein [Priestia aryabhattai]|uniref:FRG domain-containing protein n=1 Tax=Priestia aryabhattai TaxID=412384 RepID=UPI002658F3F8|nr:FRG domain-containing protein [Priestia aryabhattai]WKG30179.1 FRG domain-containing protein [Priestia aryabhattai]